MGRLNDLDASRLELSEDDITQINHLRQNKSTWDDIAQKMFQGRISGEHLRMRVRYRNSKLKLKDQVLHEYAIVTDEHNPRIAHLLAKAEVNMDEWRVTRAVVNRWGNDINPNYQAKAWLERLPDLSKWRDVIAKDIARQQREPKRKIEVVKRPGARRVMLELAPVDIHFLRIAHKEEVGEDFNNLKCVDRYRDAIIDLLHESTQAFPGIDQILLVIGNDLLHVDQRLMTAGGTTQETDGRMFHGFRLAREMTSWTIELCKQIAKTRVVVVRGNHDWNTMHFLGAVLEAEWQHDPQVTVDNEVMARKAVRYGNTALGFTHGHREKHSELPGIFQDEHPQMWADTLFHEIHIGHRHNKKDLAMIRHDQYRTCGVRILPSLTSQDAWHFEQGYRHIPMMEAHIWDFERGARGYLNHIPLEDVKTTRNNLEQSGIVLAS